MLRLSGIKFAKFNVDNEVGRLFFRLMRGKMRVKLTGLPWTCIQLGTREGIRREVH